MFKKITVVATLILAMNAWGAEPIIASAPPPTAHEPRPGSINYVEGQAAIGTVLIAPNLVGSLEVGRDQVLVTQAGKAEMLLVPGVFLRLADNSSVKMISPDLTHVVVELEKGRAMVEAVQLMKLNDVSVNLRGASVRIEKNGLYDFDADRGEVRVFNGSVQVTGKGKPVRLGRDRVLMLDTSVWKSQHFETRQYEDEFYRWNGLRSGYLSEASIDVARTYIGVGPGWYGPGWRGFGWYWSPWFSAYTFLPPDGIFYGPFGWGFYSPIAVYASPYIFYGHYVHRFPDYHYPYGHGFPPAGPLPGRMPGRGITRR